METIITTDTFEAFRTDDGILIKEKGNTARKFSLVIIAVGIGFLGVSFINLDGLTTDWITSMFTGTFFYGGILLVALGIITFVLKGLMGGSPETTIDKNNQVLILRGKSIPFSEISDIELQTTQMMSKQMTAFLFKHNGRRKGLVNGTVFADDNIALTAFVEEVKTMIGA